MIFEVTILKNLYCHGTQNFRNTEAYEQGVQLILNPTNLGNRVLGKAAAIQAIRGDRISSTCGLRVSAASGP